MVNSIKGFWKIKENISRKVETLLYIIFVKTFERTHNTETGQWLLNNMGPSRGLKRISEDILRVMEFMSSNPVAVSFNALITVIINFSATGSKYKDAVKRLSM